ncbi:MAG: hypothetical protein COV08_01210 [Candidatus Vogelbacteria bacterium CG10_big_fil_rev_8_21_14_0_10_49_38]|uniref:Uncharacterized protein n=1 Tax=Candidatus Vogelbacteria bacterium CG10_big_fil_rev_8_21_14_0_10_49_38 TaxID=1975043 RepID=A0A2H0RI34_9BACT|nr:MAG: hypothetical protein BK006_01230 [bacterium CG10_49_38]PIR46158.1 MAG: hypothetical protein COV08_01210 [Candidatus Vogelbacteria bacterium CG10_big_fil_rev_8_21_14_0_10_49_38]
MRFLSVVARYFIWHYGQALIQFSRIYWRLTFFLFNFFSVPVLVRSLFAPWRRLGEAYPTAGIDLVAIASTFIVNVIMRLVGVILRTIMIAFGSTATLIFALLYPVIFLIWLLLPAGIILLVLLGVGLLFV